MIPVLNEQTPVTEITDASYRTPQFRINEANYQLTAQLSMASDALSQLMHHGVAVMAISLTAGGAHLQTGPAKQVPGVVVIGFTEKAQYKRVRATLCGAVIEWEEFV